MRSAQPLSPANGAIARIERIVARDPGGRGIANLVQWGALAAAAKTLWGTRQAGIISGFYLPVPQVGETDGPPGAKALGCALENLGSDVVYLTDALNAPLFAALGLARVEVFRPGMLAELAVTHLVSIERPGRAADGRYYSMSARDISAFTAPLDELFLHARERHMATVAIGDGGNEIGMGNVRERVRQDVPHGATIACVVECDHLIVAGVSNWGAYGLVGALSVLAGRDLLPSAVEAEADIRAIVRAGAADGQTFRNEPTVDNLPLDAHLAVLADIRAIVTAVRHS
jgi:hypothetical protein